MAQEPEQTQVSPETDITRELEAAMAKVREVLAALASDRRRYGPLATHANTALNQLAYAESLTAASPHIGATREEVARIVKRARHQRCCTGAALDDVCALPPTQEDIDIADAILSLPAQAGVDEPHPHWKPDDKSERHPQTVEEWDYRNDPTGGALERSLRRLNVAIDYDDARAPDQMTVVLRTDLSRLMHDRTHKNAAWEMWRRWVTPLLTWKIAEQARHDASAAYNARLEVVEAERERGNWTMNVHDEFAAIGVAERAEAAARKELFEALSA